MSAPIRLYPTGLEQQFRDDAGRLWVGNDTRKPGSNPPEGSRCLVCGAALGAVTYQEQATNGTVACASCVEVASPSLGPCSLCGFVSGPVTRPCDEPTCPDPFRGLKEGRS